jgi:hypothetical protein
VTAEVWHVQFPTISKDVFFETFRVLNVFLFRCSMTADSFSRFLGKSSGMERFNLEVMQLVMASFLGHSVEHLAATRNDLDKRRKSGELSEKNYNQQLELLSLDVMETLMRETFALWSKDTSTKPADLTRAVEVARRETFDKYGRPKETPLTPIYRKMLSNWITVENMTGPKELVNFLYPNSKGDSEAAKRELSRISTLCSRLGVRFRGRVKKS